MAARKELANPFEKEKETPDAEPSDEGEGRVEVSLAESDEDDEDESDDASAAPTPRETARQRRTNRYKEMKEARFAAEQRVRELELERERERATYAAQSRAPQQPSESLDARYSKAMDDIYSEKQALSTQYEQLVAKGALTDDLKKMLWSKHRDLETKTVQLNAEYMRLRDPSNHPEHQAQSADRQAVVNWLKMEHGDILQHQMGPAILQYAAAEEARLIANGAPRDINTSKRSIEAAKLHFGLSRRPPPSPAQRARYNGASTSAGVGGGAPNGNGAPSIVLNKAQQQMAEARFPDLKPAEAYKRWAHGPGRKMLENRAARARGE